MFCRHCGAKMNDGQSICTSCGTAALNTTPKCSRCGAEIQPQARFCSNCGAAQYTYGAAAQTPVQQPTYTAPTQTYVQQPTYTAPTQTYVQQPIYTAPGQPYVQQPAYIPQPAYAMPRPKRKIEFRSLSIIPVAVLVILAVIFMFVENYYTGYSTRFYQQNFATLTDLWTAVLAILLYNGCLVISILSIFFGSRNLGWINFALAAAAFMLILITSIVYFYSWDYVSLDGGFYLLMATASAIPLFPFFEGMGRPIIKIKAR